MPGQHGRRAQGRPDRRAVPVHPRKKAIGPFKRELWDLPQKDQILADQATKIAFLFKELAVLDTRSMVDRYMQPIVHHREAPAALREAVAAS